MSAVTKELVISYMVEGLAIGFLVSSISIIGSVVDSNIDEDKTKTRRMFLGLFTLLAAFVSHVLAESLRHDRIVGLLKNVSNKFSFKKRTSSIDAPVFPIGNRFRRRSVLQPIIQAKPRNVI